jgi:protein O-GlcNAc transferase
MAVLDTSFAHALRLFRENRLGEAEDVCRSLLRVAPCHPDLLHLLAALACRTGNGEVAARAAAGAVAGEVQRVMFLNTLGVALRLAGLPEIAARWLRRALAVDPLAAEPHLNLGGLLADRRDPGAGPAMRRALALSPGSAEGHNNLGAVEVRTALLQSAMVRFGRALAVTSDYADAWRNLSGAAGWFGRIGVALCAARRGAALAPADVEVQDALANALVSLGDARGAQRPLRRTSMLRPAAHAFGSNLLFALAYDGLVGIEALAAAQAAWAARVPVHVQAFPRGDPAKRLRLGYLSGDFRAHPVAWNVEGLIRHHDRRVVEVVLYATAPQPDETTRRLAGMADRFVQLDLADEGGIAAAIRADEIDVLIALAPHTAYNPAAVLAQKPAPVVIAFHAIGSTGLATVDHWLTDAILHPEDTRERFTESLLRLPCFYLHSPPEESPEPGPPPSLAHGAVTFGSCNNPAKLTPEVVALWAQVLHAVPGSRLLLRHGRRFADPLVAARFRGLFAGHGIAADRLILEGGHLSRPAHLAVFGRIDISLDPFPFNGSTTTFESLWMGVPVVTLIGDRFVGRVGLDVLSQVGLAELAAEDARSYVATAGALAADGRRLADLRAGLRGRLLASPLCDAPAYARNVEMALRLAWRRWCESA